MMKTAEVLKEHSFLERLIGDWSVTAPEMGGGDDWTETVRSLHGIWFVAEGHGRMPDGKQATTILTLGYNAEKGKYVGSWIGSMMDFMWVYEGEVDASGNVLDLYTTGPDFNGEGLADYRERITFINPDHRTFTSSARQADGSWKQFMEAHYIRKI
ncbi:DUF1579 domain-containing protein [Rhizobium phaseoli]|uniref:Hypothetical conserved protein n=1 Tax=Rhizobium etli (strain CIAT 652) TaxID=491916 RepID=B3PTI5_RHIE6|nr:DUF1579 domain-containing protein [Rhizobium phaseoli]ACE90245.1 hypothetical conserved protein [Rhizobium etli CIAT 652]KEC76013.1 hypothetical protein RLPCCGM1_c0116 [Rhizobium leguminosarum bv. phaseoli CCGM1]PCD65212.1 DUF1579 domain-containing protein [Rhizobium phaseoli]PDS29675.1 DUF1579 domain-containing protein [Rhizobium phaseoli]PWI55357.1 hypothetical protein B5K03_05585 [Rhizobium phaseoli]